MEHVTLARLLIAQGKLEDAEALLLQLRHAAEAAKRSGSLIEILILQAIACAAQQHTEAAMVALEQAQDFVCLVHERRERQTDPHEDTEEIELPTPRLVEVPGWRG